MSRRTEQGGYVLVTVLVAVALLAVLAERLDRRVFGLRQAAATWQLWVGTQAELASAREEVLYAMVTRPLTHTGFGSGAALLRVDGSPYRLPSGVWVSVQDLRGLIALAAHDPLVMAAWLAAKGVPERDIGLMLDKLADYMDNDNLRRLNGAEAPEYAAAGLAPPANDWPLSAFDVSRVLSWHDKPHLWERASDHFSVLRDGWLNPNTAPPEILRVLPGATAEGVGRLLTLRRDRPVTDAQALLAISGIRLPDDPVSFFPSTFYRLRLWKPGSPGVQEYTVMLNPGGEKLPWLILEFRQIPQSAQADSQVQAEVFPSPARAASDAALAEPAR